MPAFGQASDRWSVDGLRVHTFGQGILRGSRGRPRAMPKGLQDCSLCDIFANMKEGIKISLLSM